MMQRFAVKERASLNHDRSLANLADEIQRPLATARNRPSPRPLMIPRTSAILSTGLKKWSANEIGAPRARLRCQIW